MPARDLFTRREQDSVPVQPVQPKPQKNFGHSAWFFCMDQGIPKTQQPKSLQGWQGGWELGRMKLGDVEPLLHRLGLHTAVSFEQFSDVAYRQLTLLLSDDFHNRIRGDRYNVLHVPSVVKFVFPFPGGWLNFRHARDSGICESWIGLNNAGDCREGASASAAVEAGVYSDIRAAVSASC